MTTNVTNALGQVVLFGVFNLPEELVESEETTMARLLSPTNVHIGAPDQNQQITVSYHTVLDGTVVRTYSLMDWCNIIGRLGDKEGLSDKRMHSLCCIPMVNRAKSLAGLPEEPTPSIPNQVAPRPVISNDAIPNAPPAVADVNAPVAPAEQNAQVVERPASPEQNNEDEDPVEVPEAPMPQLEQEEEAGPPPQSPEEEEKDEVATPQKNSTVPSTSASDHHNKNPDVPGPSHAYHQEKQECESEKGKDNVLEQSIQKNTFSKVMDTTPPPELEPADEDMPALEIHDPNLQNGLSPLEQPQQSDDDTEPPHLSPAHVKETDLYDSVKHARRRNRAHSSGHHHDGPASLPSNSKVRRWATEARDPTQRPPSDFELNAYGIQTPSDSRKTPTPDESPELQENSEKRKKRKKRNKEKRKRKHAHDGGQILNQPPLKIRIKVLTDSTLQIVKNGTEQQTPNEDAARENKEEPEADKQDSSLEHKDEENPNMENDSENDMNSDDGPLVSPPPKLNWDEIGTWEYWLPNGTQPVKKKKITMNAGKKLELITNTPPLLRSFYAKRSDWLQNIPDVKPTDHRDAVTIAYTEELYAHYDAARNHKPGLTNPPNPFDRLGEVEFDGFKALHPISNFELPVETEPFLISRLKNFKMLSLGQLVWAQWKKNEWWPASIASFVENPKSDIADVTVLWVNEKTYNDRPYHNVVPFDYAFHIKYNPRNTNIKYHQAVAKAILINGYLGFWEPFLGPNLFKEMANDLMFHGMLSHLSGDDLKELLDLPVERDPNTPSHVALFLGPKKLKSKTAKESIIDDMLLENLLVKLYVVKRRCFPTGPFYTPTWEMYPEFVESSHCPPITENAFGIHTDENEYEEDEEDIKPDVSKIDISNNAFSSQMKVAGSITRKEIEDREREDEANGTAPQPKPKVNEEFERSSFDMEIENGYEEQKKDSTTFGRISAHRMQAIAAERKGTGGYRRQLARTVTYGCLCREPFPALPGEDPDNENLYKEIHDDV